MDSDYKVLDIHTRHVMRCAKAPLSSKSVDETYPLKWWNGRQAGWREIYDVKLQGNSR